MRVKHLILRSVRSFFLGTAMSRVSGLFRDIAMAISFGSSPKIAAFMVAYRLANLFRRLFGEGNLQAGFVPHFSSLKEDRGLFFRDVFYSMILILLGTVLFLTGALFLIRPFISPDWQEVLDLTLWMLPGLIFICLYGLNSSLMQCEKKYFLPAAAPVVFNLIWIIAALVFQDVTLLAMAITIAFAGQWLATSLEGFRLLSLKEWLRPKIFSVEVRKLMKPIALGIVGVAAVQFNSALDAIFARVSDLKGPAFLWYAIRIQQLPLALFGIALSSAILPPLSRTHDRDEKLKLVRSSLMLALHIMLIATFGIFLFGKLGIELLFAHGDFGYLDVLETTQCLKAYGLGLIPASFVLILAARFYSEKNYKIPMIGSVLAVIVNVGLNGFFIFALKLGVVSIAIATTISTLINALFLARNVFTFPLVKDALKLLCLNVFASVLILGIQTLWIQFPEGNMGIISELLLLGLLYIGIILFFSRVFGLVLNKKLI